MEDWEKKIKKARKKLKDANFRDISMMNCYYCKHLELYPEINICKLHSSVENFDKETICDLYEI